MFWSSGQDGAKIERRIEPLQLGSGDEAVERRNSLAAGIGLHEQMVPAHHHGAQRPLSYVDIYFQQAIINVASPPPLIRRSTPELGERHPSPRKIDLRADTLGQWRSETRGTFIVRQCQNLKRHR